MLLVVAPGRWRAASSPGRGPAPPECHSARSRPPPWPRPGRRGPAVFASSAPGQALHVPLPPCRHRSPVTGPRRVTMAQAEEAAGEWGRAGASARAEYERRRGQGRGPPAGDLRPAGARGPVHRRSEAVHRGLGPRRRRRGARRPLARRGRRRARCGPARSRPPPPARQHRPHRGGGVGHLGHRHQALPGPAGATRASAGGSSPAPVSSWRAATRAASSPRRAGSRRWWPRR